MFTEYLGVTTRTTSCPISKQISSDSHDLLLTVALGPFPGLWTFEGCRPVDVRITFRTVYLTFFSSSPGSCVQPEKAQHLMKLHGMWILYWWKSVFFQSSREGLGFPPCWISQFSVLFFLYLFNMSVLGLFCTGFSLVAACGGYSLVRVCWLLTEVASLVAAPRP